MYTGFLGSSRHGVDARLSRMPPRCPKVLGFRENKNIEKIMPFNLSRVIYSPIMHTQTFGQRFQFLSCLPKKKLQIQIQRRALWSGLLGDEVTVGLELKLQRKH